MALVLRSIPRTTFRLLRSRLRAVMKSLVADPTNKHPAAFIHPAERSASSQYLPSTVTTSAAAFAVAQTSSDRFIIPSEHYAITDIGYNVDLRMWHAVRRQPAGIRQHGHRL